MLFASAPVVRRQSQDSGSPPTVFVVDDDVSVRESLDLLLRSAGWRPEMFDSASAFLSRPRAEGPNCLLLDVSLPDVDGLELQRRVSGSRRGLPIIFITGHRDVPMTVQAMKGGAMEFLTKPFNDDVLLRAVAGAIEKSRAELGREADVREIHNRYESLSPREREVMTLVVSGLLNKHVGARLHISEITVKAHRGNVMRKMMAGSLADLVRMATTLSTNV